MINESATLSRSLEAREQRRLVAVLVGLTVVTGIVDAASFLGLGRVFTANMTGNIVLLGFAVAGAQELSVSRSGVALVGFAAGSVFGARFVPWRGTAPEQLKAAMIAEAALLLAAAFMSVDSGALETFAVHAAIAVTAAAMGLRPAVVRRIAVPDMTTTVLTVTLAGLTSDLAIGGVGAARVRRRTFALLAIVAGAILGAVVTLSASVGVALGLAAELVAVLAVYPRWADAGSTAIRK